MAVPAAYAVRREPNEVEKRPRSKKRRVVVVALKWRMCECRADTHFSAGRFSLEDVSPKLAR
jgi:hypothetical protein